MSTCVLCYSNSAWTRTKRILLASRWRDTIHYPQKYLSESDLASRKPIILISAYNFRQRGRRIDTLRLLTQPPNDISARDIYLFLTSYGWGQAECAEFLWSQDLIPLESNVSDDEEFIPILATALAGFGRDPAQWEDFLRRLLRRHVNLHSPVPRYRWNYDLDDHFDSLFPCRVLDFGTPLDDLFVWTWRPFEGEAIANRWLQILSSEGYDVVTYLEEEFKLHAQQMQLIRPSCCRWSASYVFQISENIHVTNVRTRSWT